MDCPPVPSAYSLSLVQLHGLQQRLHACSHHIRLQKIRDFSTHRSTCSLLSCQETLKAKQVVDSEYASLVPLEWWLFAVSDTAKRVGERYHDVFSSPTRTGLKHIRSIVDEAALLEETA